ILPINIRKPGKNRMIPSFTLKKRIEQLYHHPPQDGRVICIDEFGPLSIQPYAGKGWYKQKKPDRLPATYTRKHGVRHLFAALDLKEDKLYAHNRESKRHQDLLYFLKVLRRRYHRSERLYIVLDNFSPHRHKKVKEWADENNIELTFTNQCLLVKPY
ncbi:transposase, partial [Scopulibacillus daqui]